MTDGRAQGEQADTYEPPRVEDVSTEDGPAVTAAGHDYTDEFEPT